jgi:4-amino-4-deoxy-L-arabinose transferase-like glycosyltransferase
MTPTAARKETAVVVSIVGLAALLRVAGIGWGLPDLFEEATPFRKAWEMWGWGSGTGLDLNPHFFNYPSFTFYTQFVGQGLLYVAMRVVGAVGSTVDYQLAYLFDPRPLIVHGRLINTIFAVATVWLAFAVGRRAQGQAAGVAAAVLLAVNVFHIERSQMIEVDVPLTCFTMMAFLFTLRLCERPTRRDYLFAGLAIGLAISSKYTGAFLLIALVVGHLLGRRTGRKHNHSLFLVWSVGVAAVAFLATSPYTLIDFSSFERHLSAERQHMSFGHFGAGETPTWQFYGVALAQRLLGWPAAILAVAGLVLLAVVRRRAWALVVASFVVPYLLVVGTWEMHVDRYLLPVLPLLMLFAAALVVEAFRTRELARLPASRRRLAVAAVVVLLAVPMVFMYPPHLKRRLATDTRTEAREWMEKSLPAGSLIVGEFYTPELFDPLTFWQLDKAARDRIRDRQDVPPFFATLQIPMLTVWPERTAVFYDIDLYRTADVVVTSSSVKDRYLASPLRFSQQVTFYDSLDAHFERWVEFVPDGGTGPRLAVYRSREQDTPFANRPEAADPPELGDAAPSGSEAFFYATMGLNYETYRFYEHGLTCYRRGFRYPSPQRGVYRDLALGIYRCLLGMGRRDDAIASLEASARNAPSATIREQLLAARRAELAK